MRGVRGRAPVGGRATTCACPRPHAGAPRGWGGRTVSASLRSGACAPTRVPSLRAGPQGAACGSFLCHPQRSRPGGKKPWPSAPYGVLVGRRASSRGQHHCQVIARTLKPWKPTPPRPKARPRVNLLDAVEGAREVLVAVAGHAPGATRGWRASAVGLGLVPGVDVHVLPSGRLAPMQDYPEVAYRRAAEVGRRVALQEHQGGVCALCLGVLPVGEESVDHIIPRARGGSSHFRNLQLSRRACNQRKGSSLVMPPWD
jgi:hypothetical protein